VHSQGRRLSAIDARAGRAALVKEINELPEFACHAFVNKASQKGAVHNSVIRLAPVEEESVEELPAQGSRVQAYQRTGIFCFPGTVPANFGGCRYVKSCVLELFLFSAVLELHRQGKNLKTTTNNRSIHVTGNGDSQLRAVIIKHDSGGFLAASGTFS
jgi:hypothetical protein